MVDPKLDNISDESNKENADANRTTFTTQSSSQTSSSPFSLGEFVFGGKGYFGKFSASQRHYRLQQCEELQLTLEDCEKRLRQREARAAQRATQRAAQRAEKDEPSSSSSGWNNWFSSSDSSGGIITTVENGQKEAPRKKKKKKKKNREKGTGASSSSSLSPPRIEDTKFGKKISRFYDWGLTGRGGAGPSATDAAAAAIGGGPTDVENNVVKTTNRVRKNNKSCSMEGHAVWACRAMALGCAPDLVKLRECFRDDLGTTNPEGCHYSEDGYDGMEGGMCRLEQRKVAQCVSRNEKDLKERLDG